MTGLYVWVPLSFTCIDARQQARALFVLHASKDIIVSTCSGEEGVSHELLLRHAILLRAVAQGAKSQPYPGMSIYTQKNDSGIVIIAENLSMDGAIFEV